MKENRSERAQLSDEWITETAKQFRTYDDYGDWAVRLVPFARAVIAADRAAQPAADNAPQAPSAGSVGCQYAKDVGMWPEHRCKADHCEHAANSAPSAMLLRAAKDFYNATIADSSVIIRPPSAEKRDNIKRLGDDLRAILQANGAAR